MKNDRDMDKVDVDELVRQSLSKKLYVYNDDHHSFIAIILAFIRFLGHDLEQAEQCAHIIHNTGKCCVKEDTYDRLVEMKTVLDKLQIKCEIKEK